ncbi:long-chain fatty acid--CoA ligase [bacterium]|nr:MAG: long-chain fatty acid--CoA ligase [bacterium]
MAENCIDLVFLDWACYVLGLVVVPIYPTLPAETTQYIVNDSGAKLVVVDSEKQAAKVEGTVLLTELVGEPIDLDAEPEPDPEDPCAIIYTSGTTGVPKGAVMPQRAFVSVAVSAAREIEVRDTDVFLSFLPMSHVYERVAGQVLPVYAGATIVYSKGLAHLATEMRECRPTVVLCIPRFLESLRERILDKVKKDKPIKQFLFNAMLSQGAKKAKGEFAPFAGLLDKIVGSKIREAAGGRLRYFVSGGAALAPEVGEFYMATGLTVLQGYGLTETSGGSVVNRPQNNKYWTVGEPLDVEVRIAEDGEILMRGPGVMQGYHNLPEETAQAIDADGWFHTGDIGEFEGKNLKITDRKKDLIVLGNGKNVAPQKIEGLLRTSPLIQEAVVLGDGMDSCVALIVPAEGVTDEKEIKRAIDGIKDKLAPYEVVKRFAIIHEPFSQENGMLTPTLKVKRKAVAERYKSEIAGLR